MYGGIMNKFKINVIEKSYFEDVIIEAKNKEEAVRNFLKNLNLSKVFNAIISIVF